MSQRSQYSPEFNARVTVEAAQGLKTADAVTQERPVPPVQFSQQKKELIERRPEAFNRKPGPENDDVPRILDRKTSYR